MGAIRTFEGEKSAARRATVRALRFAVEAAGVEFLEGDGVRLKRPVEPVSPNA